MPSYVHGYDDRERKRLQDQASTLVELLHCDTHYSPGATVLEVGCGTGAQTITLAWQSPGAAITSIDVSVSSLRIAEAACQAAAITNVIFLDANVFALPFAPASFDHVFVCFVLEHLAEPELALACLRRVLLTGGTITAIEGDHGSTFFHPESPMARKVIDAQVELQARSGGNANIGRQLFPLLAKAGFERKSIRVSPRTVYVDGGRPEWIEGFTLNTFTAMIEGIADNAIAGGLTTADEFWRGIQDLRRTATQDGVFCYTFFKATADV